MKHVIPSLSFLALAFVPPCFANSSQPVTFYDGRSAKVKWDLRDQKPHVSKVEVPLLLEEILPQAKKHWQGEEADFKTLAIVQGSFTKKGAPQKIIFYQYNDSGASGIFGIAVVQNDRLVTNCSYRGEWFKSRTTLHSSWDDRPVRAISIHCTTPLSVPVHFGMMTLPDSSQHFRPVDRIRDTAQIPAEPCIHAVIAVHARILLYQIYCSFLPRRRGNSAASQRLASHRTEVDGEFGFSTD